jgi:hypothetical protein
MLWWSKSTDPVVGVTEVACLGTKAINFPAMAVLAWAGPGTRGVQRECRHSSGFGHVFWLAGRLTANRVTSLVSRQSGYFPADPERVLHSANSP